MALVILKKYVDCLFFVTSANVTGESQFRGRSRISDNVPNLKLGWYNGKKNYEIEKNMIHLYMLACYGRTPGVVSKKKKFKNMTHSWKVRRLITCMCIYGKLFTSGTKIVKLQKNLSILNDNFSLNA